MSDAPAPVVKVQMMIRRPPDQVYAAFVEPDLLTRFWLAGSSGPLEQGERVRWDFVVVGASAELDVLQLEPGRRIVISWDGGVEVAWTFEPRPDESTLVTITNSGFKGSPAELMAAALDSTEGFTIVLCALKILLEHGLEANFARDKFPDLETR